MRSRPRHALLAAAILALVGVMLLVTGGAEAVSNKISSVFVTNGSSHPVPVREQNLDANNDLRVHEQGTSNVKVLGSVPVQTGIPATQFSRRVGAITPVSGPDPAGTNYAITSVTFSNGTDSLQGASLVGSYGSTSDCSEFQGLPTDHGGPLAVVPAHQTVSMTFPQPFVIKAAPGATSCLTNNGGTLTTVVGYRF